MSDPGFDASRPHISRVYDYLLGGKDNFAAGEKRSWLHAMGVRWFPLVGWAERGGYLADGHGNSVPRFHVTWGTGPAVVAPFERRVREAAGSGLAGLRFRHRVDGLTVTVRPWAQEAKTS